MLKNYQSFKESKVSRPWIHEGDFEVTSEMVDNGALIKDKMPDEVTGYFFCSYNQLTSLQGCPSTVGRSFYCSYNQLTSLQHCPSTVGRSFYCSNNKLTSLEGCPSTVDRDFDCSNNQLTSLEGCPSTVDRDFDCDNNKLNLSIEQDFIKSGSCSSQENFFIDLCRYMINKKIDLDEVTTWPEGFLSPEIIASAKGIAKFNL